MPTKFNSVLTTSLVLVVSANVYADSNADTTAKWDKVKVTASGRLLDEWRSLFEWLAKKNSKHKMAIQ